MRIVFLDRLTVDARFARPTFEHEWIEYDHTLPEQTVERLAGAQCAITNKVRIRRRELAALPDLRLIAIAATGTDCVDVEACRARGIRVDNAIDYATDAVAEHTMALVLALAKNLTRHVTDVRAGAWARSPVFCGTAHTSRTLRGRTLGIIGHGNIGRAVAARAEAFGMKTMIAERGRIGPVLDQSDVLTLHLPLTEETHHMIGREALARMKPGALLVNTARGALVDPDALIDALDAGHLAGAALDVLAEEPPTSQNRLIDRASDDLLITPHVAWRTAEAQQDLADQVLAAIQRYVDRDDA